MTATPAMAKNTTNLTSTTEALANWEINRPDEEKT